MLLEWIVVILPLAFSISIEVVSKTVREHPLYRVTVILFGIGLSALIWFQMSRASKTAAVEREAAIVETSKRVSAEVSESVSKSVTKSVSEQYAETINTLQSKIGSLEAQLAVQGRNVETIKRSNIVTGKEPIRVELANPQALPTAESAPDVHVSSMPVAPVPQYGKNARQLILTTNKVMDGARVRVTCKNKINQGGAILAGAGAMMGGGGMVDQNTYDSGIESPNWSPAHPLVITLYYDEDDLGTCTVSPLR